MASHEGTTTDSHGGNAQQPLLSAVGIGKHFGDRLVLEGVSFAIRSGQIVTLIGPNGAGKTTLVRIALGLLEADTGTITRREGLRLGYMPQSLHVEPTLPLTVYRFLQLALRGAPKPLDSTEMLATLSLLQIPHLEQAQLTGLSGGELQRVLLARALLRKPHLLVLDEPAQGVDIAGQAELYSLIDTIAETQGCGVLMLSLIHI